MARFISSLALSASIAISSACLVIVGVGPSAVLTPPPLILSPTHLLPTPHPGFSCPLLPPWSGTFVVRFGEGDKDFELDEVVVRFVDSHGIAGPSTVFDRTVLAGRFGSVGLRDHRSRGFAFAFRFGCATASSGTIFVAVRLRSGAGRTHETSGSVAVD
jgi:hypothetical protein